MTVKVSKPAVNLREELADLRKPTGIAGEAMLRAETPQEQQALIGVGRRNFVYNGDMRIAQRGTSFSNPQSYTLDRYKSLRYAAGNYTVSQQNAGLDQFQYCIRAQRDSGTSQVNSFAVNQPLEVKDSYALRGQFVTFSLYLRAGSDYSCASTTIRVGYHVTSGEYGVNYSNFTVSTTYPISDGVDLRGQTDWVKYTYTGYIPNNAVQVNCSIQPQEFSGTAGSNDYVETTGWQLELGKVATPFEHRSYGEELALCQRFFCIPVNNVDENGNSNVHSAIGVGRGAGGGAAAVWSLLTPVPMRDRPAIDSSGSYHLTDSTSRTAATPTAVSVSKFTVNGCNLLAHYTFSSSVCDDDRVVMVGAHTPVKIELDAEL